MPFGFVTQVLTPSYGLATDSLSGCTLPHPFSSPLRTISSIPPSDLTVAALFVVPTSLQTWSQGDDVINYLVTLDLIVSDSI